MTDHCQKLCIETFRKKYEDKNTSNVHDVSIVTKMINSPLKKIMKAPDLTKKDSSGFDREKLKSLNYFSFTRGLFDYKTEDTFTRNYETIKAGDMLYIWQCIGKEGADHLVGHIVTKSKSEFSFGYGYTGKGWMEKKVEKYAAEKIKNKILDIVYYVDSNEGVIYSPDYVFEYKIIMELTKPKFKSINLIASAVLIEKDIILFQDKLRKITSPHESLTDVTIYKVPGLDMYYISYFIKLKELMYCAWSVGLDKRYTNCAGFLETLFGDIISCPGFTSKYSPAPEKCKQIARHATCT